MLTNRCAKTAQIDSKEQIDVRLLVPPRGRPSRRLAVACGEMRLEQETWAEIGFGKDAIEYIQAHVDAACRMGVKNAFCLVPSCPIRTIEDMAVDCVFNGTDCTVMIYVQVSAKASVDLGVETLAGVNAGLLALWAHVSKIDACAQMEKTRLLLLDDGAGGRWRHPGGIPEWLENQLPVLAVLRHKRAAVLVMSDRAAQGKYADESGLLLTGLLSDAGAKLCHTALIPDDKDKIKETIANICRDHQPDILVMSGGTGPGPRDVTPDVLVEICDRMLDGFGEYLRHESLYFTDTAWLSRMTAGMLGATFIIALPGSPKAVKECWTMIGPVLGTAIERIRKQGFERP